MIIHPIRNDKSRILKASSVYTNSAALLGYIADSSAYDKPVKAPITEAIIKANHEKFPVCPTTSPIKAYMPAPRIFPIP
jgi:hypothetical protein